MAIRNNATLAEFANSAKLEQSTSFRPNRRTVMQVASPGRRLGGQRDLHGLTSKSLELHEIAGGDCQSYDHGPVPYRCGTQVDATGG